MTCSTLKKNFWVDVLDVTMDIEGKLELPATQRLLLRCHDYHSQPRQTWIV